MADPPRMTEPQQRRAKKLIRRLCCNYDKGNCLLLDGGEPCICVQSISCSLLCKWFRGAVLPNDMELCAEIERNDAPKRCGECGKPFVTESKNARYCKVCAARRTRRKKREWAARNRGTS
ncbi:MAG: cysteine-rich VLP domain-containing protein [Oscillospiraceae bacterium]|nr:cysteine-rich VLP domain-containing protein [Oscillospiraceae bacterium]